MSGTSDPITHQSTFQQSTYDTLKKELEDTIKKIGNYEKRELPKEKSQREERIGQYTKELTGTYNNWVVYIGLFYDTFALQSKFKINERVEIFKVKVKKSLNILKLDLDLPIELNKININTVKPLESELESNNIAQASSSYANIGAQ